MCAYWESPTTAFIVTRTRKGTVTGQGKITGPVTFIRLETGTTIVLGSETLTIL